MVCYFIFIGTLRHIASTNDRLRDIVERERLEYFIASKLILYFIKGLRSRLHTTKSESLLATTLQPAF